MTSGVGPGFRCAPSGLRLPCPPPHLRRRHPSAGESAIEVGDVSEAAVVGDRADLVAVAARVGQPAMGARQALREHIIGEGCALALEETLDEARRAAVAVGDRRHRKIELIEVLPDVLLDRGSRAARRPLPRASPAASRAVPTTSAISSWTCVTKRCRSFGHAIPWATLM